MRSGIQPTFLKTGQGNLGDRMVEHLPRDSLSLSLSLSPSSVMTVSHMEGYMNQTNVFLGGNKRKLCQIKEAAALGPSMSKLDLMNYLDNIIEDPVSDPSPAAAAAERKAQLEYLAEVLLNDSETHLPPPTDEKSIMARVNSLCSLLQKDSDEGSNSFKDSTHYDVFLNPSVQATNHHRDNSNGLFFNPTMTVGATGMEDARFNQAMKPPSGMMRKDSFGDLLLNLPRTASLPKFFNNISE